MGLLRTHSGRLVDPFHLNPEDILLEDVAESLSKINRFLGHTIGMFSVAQHSLLVSQVLPEEHKLWGLLHDATEAYLGDVPSPIKALGGMKAYRSAELRAQHAVAEHFGLLLPLPTQVKAADYRMLLTEQRDLMGMGDHPEAYNFTIIPGNQLKVQKAFVNQFKILTKKNNPPRLCMEEACDFWGIPLNKP